MKQMNSAFILIVNLFIFTIVFIPQKGMAIGCPDLEAHLTAVSSNQWKCGSKINITMYANNIGDYKSSKTKGSLILISKITAYGEYHILNEFDIPAIDPEDHTQITKTITISSETPPGNILLFYIDFDHKSWECDQCSSTDQWSEDCNNRSQIWDTIVRETCIDETEKEELVIESSFLPNPNGWNFSNIRYNMWPESWWQRFNYNDSSLYPIEFVEYPVNAKSNDFPDWPLFAESFGESFCYANFSPSVKLIRSEAMYKWKSLKHEWGGSCFGFAISSIMSFNYQDPSLTHIPHFSSPALQYNRLFDYDLNDEYRMCINYLYNYQNFQEQLDNTLENIRTITPVDMLQQVKDMFEMNLLNRAVLMFKQSWPPGGHAIVPYKITINANQPSISYIYVYDNNFPGDFERKIAINSDENTWSYFASTNSSGEPEDWGGKKGLFLSLDIDYFFRFSNGQQTRKRSLRQNNQYLEIYNSPDTNISIINHDGNLISYLQDGTLVNTLNVGIPIIPFDGKTSPPIGFYIPVANYSIETNNCINPDFQLSIFSSKKIYSYYRGDVTSNQSDRLSIDNSDIISVYNDNNTRRSINLKTVIPGEKNEKLIAVENYQLISNELIKMSIIDDNNLKLENVGSITIYDIFIKSTGYENDMTFVHKNIEITSQSFQTIIPNWDDLEKNDILLLIDDDMDGLNDHSLSLKNEYVYAILEPNATTISAESGNVTFNVLLSSVSDDISYTAFADNSWITINQKDFSKNNMISANYETNTGDERSGSISVRMINTKEKTTSHYLFSITQASHEKYLEKKVESDDDGGCFILTNTKKTSFF